jgi:chromosome segregation ATPase
VNQVNSTTQTNLPTSSFHATDLQAEVIALRQQLALRDQLVEQYSKALYHQIRLPAENAGGALVRTSQSKLSMDEQQDLEQQVFFYQQQLAEQNNEITNLRESQQQLRDRNQMLEKVIQELPQVYRQKFADRLSQVKAKMESLQRENRQLQTDLHQINFILSGRSRNAENLALPQVMEGNNPGTENPGNR